MESNIKSKIVKMCVCLVIIFIGLGFGLNKLLFYEEASDGTAGHYEPRVYITTYGECYHKASCSYVDEIFEIGLYQAREAGYRACSHCGGKSYSQIWIEGTSGEKEKNEYGISFFTSFCIVLLIGVFWFFKIANIACDDKKEDDITPNLNAFVKEKPGLLENIEQQNVTFNEIEYSNSQKYSFSRDENTGAVTDFFINNKPIKNAKQIIKAYKNLPEVSIEEVISVIKKYGNNKKIGLWSNFETINLISNKHKKCIIIDSVKTKVALKNRIAYIEGYKIAERYWGHCVGDIIEDELIISVH